MTWSRAFPEPFVLSDGREPLYALRGIGRAARYGKLAAI
jgi:hypothetical protein